MTEQESISHSSHVRHAKSGLGGSDANSSEGTSLAETAAMVAVLALMPVEASVGAEPPRMSAWARAGRREAVRPWKKQE